MNRHVMLWLSFIAICLPGACHGEEPTGPERSIEHVAPRTLAYDLPSDISEEGELLGQVWEGTTRSTRADLFFRLVPADPLTAQRLEGALFDTLLWVNPDTFESKSKVPIQYYHPAAGSQCGGHGPSPGMNYFLSGDTTYSSPEVHRPGQGSAPQGFEGHCIIPGTYIASLVDAQSETVLKSYLIDYVALAKTAGGRST